jgi:hypothetical protein
LLSLFLYSAQRRCGRIFSFLSYYTSRNLRKASLSKTPVAKLGPKHYKALELIEEGILPIREIAKVVGWNEDTLYELYEGRTEKTGPIGELFASELRKIQERNTAKAKHYIKENKTLALRKMNEYLREIQKQRPTATLVSEINSILNSLAKSTPGVEIGNLSYSYTKGLSAEELVLEFKRLQSLARSEIDRRGIPGS